jgi:hypothetical protein
MARLTFRANVRSLNAVARYLGLLARTLRQRDPAADHFEAALELNERVGARPWLAWTKCDLAARLLARGRPGEEDGPASLLRDALATRANSA